MIVKKMWLEHYGNREWAREGWYLLGFLPLYIRDMAPRERRKREQFGCRINLST